MIIYTFFQLTLSNLGYDASLMKKSSTSRLTQKCIFDLEIFEMSCPNIVHDSVLFWVWVCKGTYIYISAMSRMLSYMFVPCSLFATFCCFFVFFGMVWEGFHKVYNLKRITRFIKISNGNCDQQSSLSSSSVAPTVCPSLKMIKYDLLLRSSQSVQHSQSDILYCPASFFPSLVDEQAAWGGSRAAGTVCHRVCRLM